MQGAASEAGPDTGLAMCCGQAGCWTDGDASEAARRVSDFLVGAPRVATRVSEIQYQCEGGPQRNRLVPSASSVSNEVKSLSVGFTSLYIGTEYHEYRMASRDAMQF